MSDILWYNSLTHETQIWYLDGFRVIHRETVLAEDGKATSVGPPWSIVGISFDAFQPGDPSIVWHNSITQETQFWGMFNSQVSDRQTALGETGSPTFIGPPFSIVGVGDFNGSLTDDLLWHNSITNETQIWFMRGARVTGRATVLGETGNPAFVGPPFSIVAVGDFDGDGTADIVWHHKDTHETQIWFMKNYRVSRRGTVLWENGTAAYVGPPWSIVGAGDFNRDGKADLVWHNSTTGETQIWYMDGFQLKGRQTVLGEDGKAALVGGAGSTWSIAGIKNFTRDRVQAKPTDSALESWSAWTPFDFTAVGRPAVERDPANRLQLFVRVPAPVTVAAHDSIWRLRQSGQASPPWLPWQNLGGPGGVLGDPVIAKSYDGRLEIFCRGAAGTIQHIAQRNGITDEWAGWETLGSGGFVGNPAVSSNADGRLEVFAAYMTRTGLTLLHCWQTGQSNPVWSAWEDLGGHPAGSPAVGGNRDGRLEVFVRAAGNVLQHIWQTAPNSGWSGWESLGTGGLAGDPAVASNADGRLEVFVRGTENALWHIWQTGLVNIVWSPWESLGGVAPAGDPVVSVDLDGRLEVFVRATVEGRTSLWTLRQTRSFSIMYGPSGALYAGWQDMQGLLAADPAVGTNWDGRLEVFGLMADQGVYHLWQQPAIQWVPGSTMRLTMGGPPGDRPPDGFDRIPDGDLGQSVMHNGNLYLFLADGTLDFADPIGSLTPSGGASEDSQGLDLAPDRDAAKDFAGFHYGDFQYGLQRNPFTSLFHLNTPLGPKILGQNQGAGGGFSYDGHLYVFGGVSFLNPALPPGLPWIPSPYVVGDDRGTYPKSIPHTILTSSSDPWGPYDLRFAMGELGAVNTHKFDQVSPVLVKNAEIPLLPKSDDFGRVVADGVIMLGQGGDKPDPPGIYIAWMPLRPGSYPNASEMKFYTGNAHPPGNETPYWSKDPAQAKRLFDTRYYWSSISIGRIRSTGKWIMLYQKTLPDTDEPGGGHPEERHDGIYARIGATPWDWFPEVTIFDPDRERAWGDYIRDEVEAFPYGAALLRPYTNWDAANRIVTIQYLLSTQHPYGVVLMRSQIQINP